MENKDSDIPVITLDDDEDKKNSEDQQQMEEELGGLNSPKDFLIPAALGGAKVFSPGLESTALDESAFEESTLKNPHHGCLESTRLSNHCVPGEFDPENDLSKVQEASDSRNPLNAGFVHNNSNSLLPESTINKIASGESSSGLAESDSEAGQVQDLESSNHVGNTTSSNTQDREQESVQSSSVQEGNGEASLLLSTSSSAEENDTANSDPEVEQLMKLPDTVTELTSKEGVKVYIVGTAHFSLESQEDVAKTIRMTHPRVVVVELCVSRLNILRYDEETIMEEAKNLNMEKIRSTIKQYGAVQGGLYLLFLSTSAHLTRQLGMAPGGEFRRAWQEARDVSGCRIHLGDRPIHVTLQRALAALSVWQKLKLVWHLLLNRNPISAEDVERCKQKDLLEEMLEEMTGEFPTLSRVFVDERDLCLAHSMQLAATDAASEAERLSEPPVVVGVVGIGHVSGIKRYFGQVSETDVRKVMKVPPPSRSRRVIVLSVKLSVAGLLCYGCYRIAPKLPFNLSSIRQAIFSLSPNSPLMIYECHENCSCTEDCANRLVQKGPHQRLNIMEADAKGWGLSCGSDLDPGTFVCEYAGEVIGDTEARRRFAQRKTTSNYIFCLREHFGPERIQVTYVDPTFIGNIGRYINHSCDPNLTIVPVRVENAVPKICLFARRHVVAGTELTFDYGGGCETTPQGGPFENVPNSLI
uniref:EOG090X0AQH n=1 Tax=Alona affinis TaxID=381656 RepID=A0A9N6WP75_9CRUS|nr:EOG090X0AQH [Alona affinis]